MSVGLSGGDLNEDLVGRKDELAPVEGILEPKAVAEVGVHKVIFHPIVEGMLCLHKLGVAQLVAFILYRLVEVREKSIAKTDI